MSDVVREQVVRDLRATFQVDGSLVVVSALVCRAPVVHFEAAHVEGVTNAVEAVVRRAMGCGVGVSGIRFLAFDGEVGIVVIDGKDGLATRQIEGCTGFATRCHGDTHAHEFLFPHGQAVEPADAAVYGLWPYLFIRRCLEVEQRLSALDGKAFVCGGIEQCLVVLIAMSSHVVIAVHNASFDVYLEGWPLVERLRLRLGVGGVDDVVERFRLSVHDVQSLLQFLASLGLADDVVVDTTGYVECGVLRHIVVHEDVERTAIGIDACGITHVRTSRTHHLVVTVVGIAVGFVVVDAEVLLVVCPVAMLQL